MVIMLFMVSAISTMDSTNYLGGGDEAEAKWKLQDVAHIVNVSENQRANKPTNGQQ